MHCILAMLWYYLLVEVAAINNLDLMPHGMYKINTSRSSKNATLLQHETYLLLLFTELYILHEDLPLVSSVLFDDNFWSTN